MMTEKDFLDVFPQLKVDPEHKPAEGLSAGLCSE